MASENKPLDVMALSIPALTVIPVNPTIQLPLNITTVSQENPIQLQNPKQPLQSISTEVDTLCPEKKKKNKILLSKIRSEIHSFPANNQLSSSNSAHCADCNPRSRTSQLYSSSCRHYYHPCARRVSDSHYHRYHLYQSSSNYPYRPCIGLASGRICPCLYP